MIVVLAGQKGGTGKSTTAVSIAVEWCARGLRVLLVDLDPQGSVRTWGDVAAEAKVQHTPTVVALGAGLHHHLPPLAAAHDLVVIDCPPRHGELQRAALVIADVALLPSGPDPTEVWGLTESAEIVRGAMAVRPQLVPRVLITRTDRRTVLGTQARGTLEQVAVPVLSTVLSRRITYPEAMGFGRGPTTHDPRSEASREVKRLVNELEQLAPLVAREPAPAPKRARGR